MSLKVAEVKNPDRETWTKPWLVIPYFAGRGKSKDMMAHSQAVFDAAFKMLSGAERMAKNSGDKEMLRKLDDVRAIWEKNAENGVRVIGVGELKSFIKGGALPKDTDWRLIKEGIDKSDVNKVTKGLQSVLDPYAAMIWEDESSTFKKLDKIQVESDQYGNKSEAVLKGPLWRRGLERIWQAFSVIPIIGPKSTNEQLATMRDTISNIYAQEIDGTGEIGKWFGEMAQKSFIAVVLARARESGSIDGISTVINQAIEDPNLYSAYNWPGRMNAARTAPGTSAITSMAQENAINNFKAHAQILLERIELVASRDDPAIPELNYMSIELVRSINSMRSRMNKNPEIDEILKQINESFNRKAEKLNLKIGHVVRAGRHNFGGNEGDDAFKMLKDDLAELYTSGELPMFRNEEELEKFLVRIRPRFINTYNQRRELFEELLRDKPEAIEVEAMAAPVFG